MADEGRYSIEELAELGGVSRRTVRFYVQEGLLPAPLGVGRGRHYDEVHLTQLRNVRALQEAGLSLQEIRVRLSQQDGTPPTDTQGTVVPVPLPRSTWRRLILAPGVELQVSSDVRLPAQDRLEELAAWCRTHLTRSTQEDSE